MKYLFPFGPFIIKMYALFVPQKDWKESDLMKIGVVNFLLHLSIYIICLIWFISLLF